MELRCVAGRSARLSDILKQELAMSTGLMNRLKWIDAIRVNGRSQRTNYQVQPGDVVTVTLLEPEPEYPAEDGPLAIVYEDPHILVVDKPAGMLIHPSAHKNTGTLANLVLGHYRRTGQARVFHPVTRLDRDTFGLVLLGKNSHIHQRLSAIAREGRLTKVYHGLVYGHMAPEAGSIEAPIARRPLPSLLRYVEASGQPSVTQYRTLAAGPDRSLLELRPITGRTHQLRVHCAHRGCPILGDPQYGTLESLALSRLLGLTTQQLCAKHLRFPHPITGERMELTSGFSCQAPEGCVSR